MPQSENLQNIPFEITTDILTRLPVKSLLRFRCVSKSFCSLIDSNTFVKLHLNQSLLTKSNRHLILGGLDVKSISLDSLDTAKVLKPPYRCSEISSSFNGLLLILGETPYLWNPFTRKSKELPRLEMDYPDGVRVSSACEIYGFGYDEGKDDYKVLRLVEYGLDFEWISSQANIYSLKSNTWRRIKDFPYKIHSKKIWRVYVNGALHTVVLNNFILRSVAPKIMAFDISKEEHYRVPLPEIPAKEFNLVGLDMLEGYLCVLNARKKHRIDVWIMKEYRNKESWTKLMSIAPPSIERYSGLSPLVFSRDGSEVLINSDDKWLLWYNLKSKTVKNIPVEGLPYIFNAEVAVESLIPLDKGDGFDRFRNQCQQETARVVRKNRKKRDEFLSEGFKLVL